ncbi:MAG: cysteine peptidase family C39 domain-containing protein [Planctomycetota bacterium]|jgi:hypothetical protein
MKIKTFVLIAILLFIAKDSAFAGEQLNRTEILQIFKTLTDQPKRTWIPSGTITATHYEYKTSTGYMTESTVTVKYDGDRFYWEINIDSHTKQAEAEAGQTGQPSLNTLDLSWNRHRVFTWDGERHTMYYKSGNHAVVREGPSDIPVRVDGPLSAGIVPWGHGVYTLEELSAAESSAEVDDQGHVHLTVNREDGFRMVFVLDPAKDYALMSYSIYYQSGASIIKDYGDYESVLGKWVPTTIIIKRYNDSKPSSDLATFDHWDLTSISPVPPQSDSFRAPYETDTQVEFYSPISKKAFWYRHYSEVDTESLLQKKLEIEIASTEGAPSRNCATVAMKCVLERLGKNVTDQQLAGLVSGPNKSTNFYALRQFARDLGLYCRAVKTDLRALKNLKNCQAILHLPRANHYVVFEYIDGKYVWLIDLDSNKFFYRTKLKDFGFKWIAGTALFISDKPLDADPNNTPINDSELQKITGSTEGGIPNFSCTGVVQLKNRIKCPPRIGLCGGAYHYFPDLCGCKEDPNGTGCHWELLIGVDSRICIEDPLYFGNCEPAGERTVLPKRACMPMNCD